MKKLFGTDGIRGKANVYPITPELALLVGKATALVLGAGGNDGPQAGRARQGYAHFRLYA